MADVRVRPHHERYASRPLLVADALRRLLEEEEEKSGPMSEEEKRQALLWAQYPKRIAGVKIAVYANKHHENLDLLADTVPSSITILTQVGKWAGTIDKLNGYWNFLQTIEDDAIVIFVDAFDVFGNGKFDGHELLSRFFAFGKPVVISTEENLYPREVKPLAYQCIDALAAMGQFDRHTKSPFVNAGGQIGYAWALRKIYDDIHLNMVANDWQTWMNYADMVGHWFLQAYDQYELWRYVIRHTEAAFLGETELMLTLDTEQTLFGSTVLRKSNWNELLGDEVKGGVNGEHSIDVDEPLVFDAPQRVFEIGAGCRASFAGRGNTPLFWHGHGPWKPAWEGLRNRMRAAGCIPPGASHGGPRDTVGLSTTNVTN